MKNIKIWQISLFILIIFLLVTPFIITKKNNTLKTEYPNNNLNNETVTPNDKVNNSDELPSSSNSQNTNNKPSSSSSSNKQSNSGNNISNQNKTIVLEDRSGNANCAQAIEYFYADKEYQYYFNCIKSNSMYVIVNGTEYKLVYVLENGIVTIKELENAGYKIMKKSKNLQTK